MYDIFSVTSRCKINISFINMEISGKIIVAMEPRSGKSARTGNNWIVQSYVVETHEQYPKRCVFEIFGEDRIKEANVKVGDEVTVSFDIDAREYQGRWYNSVRAWRVQHITADAMAGQPLVDPVAPVAPAPAPAAPAATSETPAAPASNGTVDDLPF